MVSLVIAGDQVAALLSAGQPATADVLASVPWLETAAAREQVAAALADAAEFISGFEYTTGPASGPSKVLEAPIAVLPPGEAFSVRLLAKDLCCQGVGLSAERLQFLAPQALVPNFLVDVELARDGERLRAWVKVTACQPRGGGFLVEATPFALSADARDAWHRLASSAPERAPLKMSA
jgi:hypothetical protein